MTQALLAENGELRVSKKVLEIGTGSGYQTAILAPLVRQIFSIERVGSLLEAARKRLVPLGAANVRFRHDDGHRGWPGQAPFDGIIVSAAPDRVPEVLLEQLASGGRLVMPVGSAGSQNLVRVTNMPSGFEQENLCRVSFVPMLRDKK